MDLKLFTSRYQAQNLILESGLAPVSISVSNPRFPLRYTLAGHLAEITPPRKIITYELERYRPLYLAMLEKVGSARILTAMEAIAMRAQKDGLVLLCYEDITKDFCHRRLFAEWFEQQTGIVVPELATRARVKPKPSKPKGQNAIQVSLFDLIEA
jgi:hypothetical protein